MGTFSGMLWMDALFEFSDLEFWDGKTRYTGIAGVTYLEAALLLFHFGGSPTFYAFQRIMVIRGAYYNEGHQ